MLNGKEVQSSTEVAQALRGSNFWNMMVIILLSCCAGNACYL